MDRPSSGYELLGRTADKRLLGEERSNLPASVGAPPPIPSSRARPRLVAVGVMLTGATLVGGLALLALGVVVAVAGGSGILAIAALTLGAILVATHWGWVHVAELSANRAQARSSAEPLAERRRWLAAIEPYERWEVSTEVGDDGSISIVRSRYHPVASGARTFSFALSVETVEEHSGDEPAAVVAERAEVLRREAARDTEAARRRFRAQVDAHETATLEADEERDQLQARRATARALSDRINQNLREPPLSE
jgi:hypothetical protein